MKTNAIISIALSLISFNPHPWEYKMPSMFRAEGSCAVFMFDHAGRSGRANQANEE